MKKIIYILIVLTIISCKQEKTKNYITFSGKITNPSSDSLIVMNPRIQYRKVIKLSQDGTFKDTLMVQQNYLSVFLGKEYATLYAKGGDEINMTLNSNDFDNTLTFSGIGSEASNQMAKANLLQKKIFNDEAIFKLEKDQFEVQLSSYTDDFIKSLEKNNALDSMFIVDQKRNFQGLKGYLNKIYEEKHYLLTKLGQGIASPKFNNYENYAGGVTSLDDLKGKYVYIDLWATWCGPCKVEIPYLKELESNYHGKNIEFVSISVDRKRDYDKWKNMVKEKELTGIQLYANEDESFTGAYKVDGIPRFILIDPQGNIVSSDAPRPSNPALVKLFDELKI